MARVARGDRAAAATVFERHRDVVYRYLRGIGMEPATAEDVTQDVFVAALSRASDYRGTGSLAGWLLRIARTTALDRFRSTAARRGRERRWAAERRDSHERDARGSDRGRLVDRILRGLPADDREVIVLARFLELHSDRIAEILEISPGAVRVRLHRALRRLADGYSEVRAS